MADLSNQKISDTYGRVLQRDVDSGEIQNLLGQNPNNIIFNGTTIRYVDGNQQDGYVLTSDSIGNVRWAPPSGGGGSSVLITGGSFDKLTETLTLTDSTGGTVSITGFTDVYVSGVTYNDSNLLTFSRNDGTNLNVLVDTVSGWTVNGNLNVSGDTLIDGNLSVSSISASSYVNLPNFILSAYSGGDGISILSGVTDSNIGLKSFSGVNISIIDSTDKLTFSGQPTNLNSGTEISITGTYPNFTITNTSPDQTVSLVGGNGISITGTYPNFNIDYTGSTFSLVGSTTDGITTYRTSTSLNVESNLTFNSTTRLLNVSGFVRYNQLQVDTNRLILGSYGDEGSEILFASYTDTTTGGTIYYSNSGGTLSVADNTTTATSISLLSIAIRNNAKTNGMLLKGLVPILSTNISGTPILGNPVYLSTSGQMTFTLPTTSGSVVRIMGYYIETINDGGGNDYRIIYFNPSNDYIVLA